MSPASNDHKRKGEDGAPQPRAKRNRYISIAWYRSLSLAHGHGHDHDDTPTDDGPAMNASAARSSATGRRPASAAATSASSVCTRPTAATTSRSPSMRPRTHATRHG
jgi:hypothetical protein